MNDLKTSKNESKLKIVKQNLKLKHKNEIEKLKNNQKIELINLKNKQKNQIINLKSNKCCNCNKSFVNKSLLTKHKRDCN